MLGQSYFVPFGVKALASSATSQGITSKIILMGTFTDQASTLANSAPPQLLQKQASSWSVILLSCADIFYNLPPYLVVLTLYETPSLLAL